MLKRCFTLIELVIVMVLIGVLSIIAIPKMVNLKEDVNTVKLTALKAGIYSFVSVFNVKALTNGYSDTNQTSSYSLTINSDNYPAASCYSAGTIYYHPFPVFEDVAAVMATMSSRTEGISDILLANDSNYGVGGVDGMASCDSNVNTSYKQKIGYDTSNCYFLYDPTTGTVADGVNSGC